MDTIVKTLTVGIFATLLYFIIDFVVEQIINAIDLGALAPTIRYYMCRLGIFDAVNIFVSLLIGSWFANKIISYISG